MRRNDYDQTLQKQIEQGIKAGTYSLDQTGNAIDQQAIRYAPMALRTHVIAFSYGASKFLTFFVGIIGFIAAIMTTYAPGIVCINHLILLTNYFIKTLIIYFYFSYKLLVFCFLAFQQLCFEHAAILTMLLN